MTCHAVNDLGNKNATRFLTSYLFFSIPFAFFLRALSHSNIRLTGEALLARNLPNLT